MFKALCKGCKVLVRTAIGVKGKSSGKEVQRGGDSSGLE